VKGFLLDVRLRAIAEFSDKFSLRVGAVIKKAGCRIVASLVYKVVFDYPD
jgi:hypothetical protein